MTEATIVIPNHINMKKISEDIIYHAFNIAVDKKKKELKKELKRTLQQIQKYERKYQTSLERFEREMGNSMREHDDWMEWSFLVENKNQLEIELENFQTAGTPNV